MLERFPQDLLINQELLEPIGQSKDFNHARLQLVKKKDGATGSNLERLEDGK
jgi:hypothetical protein